MGEPGGDDMVAPVEIDRDWLLTKYRSERDLSLIHI